MPARQEMTRGQMIGACRDLLRGCRSGSLSTVSAASDGWPYASLVTYATDGDGCPLFLLSTLADHTRNIAADPRAALLVEAASGRSNPQTGPRVTLLGKVRKSREPRHAKRFLARHPQAELYAGFGDFAFYRMTVEKVHFVGGFARARWLRGRDVRSASAAAKAVAAVEDGVVEHMNGDHADALDLIANRIIGRRGSGWKMCGLDPEGVDLVRDGRWARVAFRASVGSPGEVRSELVRLAGEARGKP